MNEKMLKLAEEIRAKNDVLVVITPYGDTRKGMSSMGLRLGDAVLNAKDGMEDKEC